MTDQITVPRATWDAMWEALVEAANFISPYSIGEQVLEKVDAAITAANAVSEQHWQKPQVEEGFFNGKGCSNALRQAGKAYPRTCSVCGLGPCGQQSEQPQAQVERENLAAILKQYGGDGGSVYHRHLLQAAAFLAAHPQATEPAWRPIESAPHSANPVLALSESGTMKIETGYWLVNMLHASKVDGENCNFTHWMSLPAAPEAHHE